LRVLSDRRKKQQANIISIMLFRLYAVTALLIRADSSEG
jgi:hypothetical protein